MSEQQLPPLDPELAALFARANEALEPDDVADRVRDGVSRAMVLRGLEGLSPPPSPPTSPPGAAPKGDAPSAAAPHGTDPTAGAATTTASLVTKAAATKIAVLAATAGIAVGGAAGHEWGVRDRDAASPQASAIASASASARSPAPTVPSALQTAPPPPPTLGREPSHDVPKTPDGPAKGALGRSALRRERELVDGASSALRAGHRGKALELGAQHRKEFPRGQLREEREVIVIEALVEAGRKDEARARLREFKAAFPASHARARLESKIDSEP